MSGIGTGLVATLAYMNPADIGTYAQLIALAGSGGGIGYYLSTKIGPTELPQAVAAFHSLVGVAAACTAVGTNYLSIFLSRSLLYHTRVLHYLLNTVYLFHR